MQPEALFHRRINKRLPREVYVEKMHNIYRGGTPDYWYSGYKADLWVEYKWLRELPIHADVKPDLSALQLLWLNRATERGRNVCVIIGSPSGCAILIDGQWNHPISLATFCTSEKDVADWIAWRVHDPAFKERSGISEFSIQDCNTSNASCGS